MIKNSNEKISKVCHRRFDIAWSALIPNYSSTMAAYRQRSRETSMIRLIEVRRMFRCALFRHRTSHLRQLLIQSRQWLIQSRLLPSSLLFLGLEASICFEGGLRELSVEARPQLLHAFVDNRSIHLRSHLPFSVSIMRKLFSFLHH